MDIVELNNKLCEAYSNENLNRLAGKLIALYKNKNYSAIRQMANKIGNNVSLDEESHTKCFSRLIMLYHPDKGEQMRKSINVLYEKGDLEGLTAYSHILLITDMDLSAINVSEEIDYHPEYTWDAGQKDGFIFNQFEEKDKDDYYTTDNERSFYNAIKLREYGRLDIEFPPYYLEDFEEFEMSSYGIESLEGVEYCKHVRIMDLSNNEITDLAGLEQLEFLEELYLANNRIGFIDALAGLTNLKVLDISDNEIDDLSPIFDLERLEFINVSGNPVDGQQVKKLRDKGVVVIA